MASVTKCDACGSVYEHVECLRMDLIHINKHGGVGCKDVTYDLCPHCANEIKEFLGGKKNGFQ